MISNKEELFELLVKEKLDNNNIAVLRLLKDENLSNTRLSEKIGVSTPLMSYYINGNKNSKGLSELGLIRRVLNKKGVPFLLEITELGEEILEILK